MTRSMKVSVALKGLYRFSKLMTAYKRVVPYGEISQ